MNKELEAISEKYSISMCYMEKLLTLIKMSEKIQFEDNEYNKKDLLNLAQITYSQAIQTYDKFKETENFLNKILVEKNISC